MASYDQQQQEQYNAQHQYGQQQQPYNGIPQQQQQQQQQQQNQQQQPYGQQQQQPYGQQQQQPYNGQQQNGQAAPPQDALDKGIAMLLKKTGHNQSNSTIEKISDGIRVGYKKLTGKNIPIKDK